jgi:hypothetical protein
MDRDRQRRAAAENVIGAFDRLAFHYAHPRRGRRRFNTVEAVATGHDAAFFNPVVAFLPDAAATDVLAALEWVEGGPRGVRPPCDGRRRLGSGSSPTARP